MMREKGERGGRGREEEGPMAEAVPSISMGLPWLHAAGKKAFNAYHKRDFILISFKDPFRRGHIQSSRKQIHQIEPWRRTKM